MTIIQNIGDVAFYYCLFIASTFGFAAGLCVGVRLEQKRMDEEWPELEE